VRRLSISALVVVACVLGCLACQSQLSRETALSILKKNSASLLNPDATNNLFNVTCEAVVAVDPAQRSHPIFDGVAREDPEVQYANFLFYLAVEGLLQRNQSHEREFMNLAGTGKMHVYEFLPIQPQSFDVTATIGTATFRIGNRQFSKVTGLTEGGVGGGPNVVIAEVEISNTPTDSYTRLARAYAKTRAKYPYFDHYTMPPFESVIHIRVPFMKYDDGWRLAR
jgi:hypothetical protein